jgi:hypothetical protein
MNLPYDADYKNTIKTFITKQLTEVQSTGLSTSVGGLEALQVKESSTYPIQPEMDDESITILT